MESVCSSWQKRQRAQENMDGTPNQGADGIRAADIEHSHAKLPRPHMGRPVVAEVLASLCKQHAAEASIGVIAAGKQTSSLEPICETLCCAWQTWEACGE